MKNFDKIQAVYEDRMTNSYQPYNAEIDKLMEGKFSPKNPEMLKELLSEFSDDDFNDFALAISKFVGSDFIYEKLQDYCLTMAEIEANQPIGARKWKTK